MTMLAPTLALGAPGPFELVLLMLVGLLLFGKRLPEVGRSIGQTVVQFKKGLNEVSEEVKNPSSSSAPPSQQLPETPKVEVDTSNYKFDPHTGKPIER
jgi:sec-independent protein translocase protein TatA